MKTIAIMQPTFLPWIGYFSLIDRVDEFVFLDNVQFDKRSWQQRNRIKTPQGPIWLTVPVVTKGRSDQLIQDVEILRDPGKEPFHKIKAAIAHNYKKAKYYDDYADDFGAHLSEGETHLAHVNQAIIQWVCKILDIETRFFRASALNVTGKKEDLLVDICKERGADRYISPPGSKAYLDESDAFDIAGVQLSYHEYEHPSYSQLYGDFEPYMCIADLLFNEGPGSTQIIKRGLPDT